MDGLVTVIFVKGGHVTDILDMCGLVTDHESPIGDMAVLADYMLGSIGARTPQTCFSIDGKGCDHRRRFSS